MMQPTIMQGGGFTPKPPVMSAPSMMPPAAANQPKYGAGGPISSEAAKIDNPFASIVPKGLKTDVQDFKPSSTSFTPSNPMTVPKPFQPTPF